MTLADQYLQNHHRDIIDNSQAGVVLIDLHHSFIYANRTFCDLVEYTEEELFSKTFDIITHPSDAKDDLRMFNNILHGTIDQFSMVKRYISKSGKIVWVKIYARALKEEQVLKVFHSEVLKIEDSRTEEALEQMKSIIEEHKRLISSKDSQISILKHKERMFLKGVEWFKKNWITIVIIASVIILNLGGENIANLIGVLK